ncbi:MAG UNVERIFIED_CONTAM: hypothetical protein LVT10_17610 [Anaerolineae bacterium]
MRLREMDNTLTVADRWCVQIPFSGYYAWVTVATVINTVTLLMTLGSTTQLLGIEGPMWSAILQAIAMLIAVSMIAYSQGNHGMVAYTRSGYLGVRWRLQRECVTSTNRRYERVDSRQCHRTIRAGALCITNADARYSVCWGIATHGWNMGLLVQTDTVTGSPKQAEIQQV